MRVLVTGGAGFIGSHVTEALIARGDRVVVIDNFDLFYERELKRANLRGAAESSRMSLVEGDIRKASDIQRAISLLGGVDVVVHLAARAGVRPSIANPGVYADVNVVGTAVLLDVAQRSGVRRFVFASSSSVYGARSSVPFFEADRVDPVSPYAATKIAGEMMCSAFGQLYGLSTVALRFFTVYGPRQRPDLAVGKFLRAVLKGGEIPMFGDGNSARDYTFVTDIVTGVLAAIDRDFSRFEVINLGGSRPVSLRELVRAIEAVTGVTARVVPLSEQSGDVPVTCAALEKAAGLLNWTPTVSLRIGLERYLEWLRSEEGALWM